MNRFLVLPLIVLALHLASCSGYGDNQSALRLGRAKQAMVDNEDEVADLLKSVNPDELSKDDYHTYMLIQARVLRSQGLDISFMEQAVYNATEYFSRRQDAQNTCIAHYTMAKVHESRNEPAEAVRCYLLADEWAAKADYRVAGFIYPDIPYSIARHYKKNEFYSHSVEYLHKALRYVNSYNNYEVKLYTLELLGNNFFHLKNLDSLVYYQDKALELVEQHNNANALVRISYNRILMFFSMNDFNRAEEWCKSLLIKYGNSNDSIFHCLVNTALSKIYYNTNRIDLASKYIYKAKEFIGSVDTDNALGLLDHLHLIEKKMGHIALSNAYKEQYNALKIEQEAQRKKMLAEQQASVRKREQEVLAKSVELAGSSYLRLLREQNVKAIGFTAAAVVVLLLVGWYAFAERRRRESYRRQTTRYITAKYAKARNDARLVDFITEMTEDEAVRRALLDDLDGSCLLASDSQALEPFKHKLFGSDYDCCIPILTDRELELCYLIDTQRHTPVQVMEMVGIDAVAFVSTRISLEHKLAAGGYRLPRGYRAMQAKVSQGLLAV